MERRWCELAPLEKGYADDLASCQPAYDEPTYARMPAPDPRSSSSEERASNQARKKVDAVGLALDDEFPQVTAATQVTGQDNGQRGIEAN